MPSKSQLLALALAAALAACGGDPAPPRMPMGPSSDTPDAGRSLGNPDLPPGEPDATAQPATPDAAAAVDLPGADLAAPSGDVATVDAPANDTPAADVVAPVDVAPAEVRPEVRPEVSAPEVGRVDVAPAPDAMVGAPDGGAVMGAAEFPIPTPNASPSFIVAGKDDHMYFSYDMLPKLGRVSMTGVVTEFPLPAGTMQAYGIAAASDGGVWYSEPDGNRISRMSTSGAFTHFALPATLREPRGITVAGGAVWFAAAASRKIGRLAANGTFTEFQIPSTQAPEYLTSTGGTTPLVWFTLPGGHSIGRMTLTGSFVIRAIPGPMLLPMKLAPGSDGADGRVWFTAVRLLAPGGWVGTATLNESPSHFMIGAGPTPTFDVAGIARGPENAIWYALPSRKAIGGKHATDLAHDREFPVTSAPLDVAAGPGRTVWYTSDVGNVIGRITY